MKNICSPLLLLLLALPLSGCHRPTASPEAPAADSAAFVPGQPIGDREVTLPYTVSLGGHTYHISLHRQPADSLPPVSDSYGQPYIDNIVDLSIRRDSRPLLSRRFTKADFRHLLSPADATYGILCGMSFDAARSTASELVFGAQVSEPGCEGGSLFRIVVATAGGTTGILRDEDLLAGESTPEPAD